MSNLLKSVCFQVKNEEKILIDSNKRNEQAQEIKSVEKEALKDFDFVPGMNVINIEEVIKQEREKMSEETGAIVEQARKDADQIRNQAMEDAAVIRARAQEEGKQQGYQDGFDAGQEECKTLEKELTKKKKELEQEYQDRMKQMEPFFADLTANLVEHIIGVSVEDHKQVIMTLIENCLKSLPKSNKYTFRVSKEEAHILENRKEELRERYCGGREIEILEDETMKKNQCVIELDTQIIDCSLDEQLKKLRNELKLLAYLDEK